MRRRMSSGGILADFFSVRSRVIGPTMNGGSGGGLQPTARHLHGAHNGMQQQRTEAHESRRAHPKPN
jgi:hypothetical protein